jgi:hypothetical protein
VARNGHDGALPALANLHEEIVMDGTVINGNRMHLSRFVDRRSPPVLLAQIHGIWAQRPAPLHRFARDGWLVLTQVVGSSVETVEIRARGDGSEGRRTRLARLDGSRADPLNDSAWLEEALPQGSKVLDHVTHSDGGRAMSTLVAVTSATAEAVSLELLAEFVRRGFASQPRHAPSFKADAGLVHFLARGSEDLALTISEQQSQRTLVIHWGRSQR